VLVKDEADIIRHTVGRLLGQVDHIIVSDNGSTDGTRDLLYEYTSGGAITVLDDPEVGYYQDRKTTALARQAKAAGHDWVLPCDADEFWYATDGRTIGAFLAGLAPDVAFVDAPLYNHIPTALDDDDEANPFRRIGWRQREHGALGKVCARLRPGLEIRMGNHSAYAPGVGTTSGGLVVRHFSWRSPEQYLRKIRNGEAAYAATNMNPGIGAHWRMFEGVPDETVLEHFRLWFWQEDPSLDETLIYDPAPGA
jgi:hypothetical protein